MQDDFALLPCLVLLRDPFLVELIHYVEYRLYYLEVLIFRSTVIWPAQVLQLGDYSGALFQLFFCSCGSSAVVCATSVDQLQLAADQVGHDSLNRHQRDLFIDIKNKSLLTLVLAYL